MLSKKEQYSKKQLDGDKMDKEIILLAWEHIKTLRGSNLGDYN